MNGHPARWIAAGFLLIAAVGGCAQAASERPASASPTTSPTSVTPTEATTSELTPSPQPLSYLQRRDTPPGGVAAQFEWFGLGADEPCSGFDGSQPGVLVDGTPPEVASYYVLCVIGLGEGAPIDVAVTLPDGSVRPYTIDADSAIQGLAILGLQVFPGEPIGIYTVTATQELSQVSGSYEVFRSSLPRTIVIPPWEGSPGATFRIAFAGFPPASQIELDLYRYRLRTEDEIFGYLTTLPPVATDRFGEATYELPTAVDDPTGNYCLVYRPAADPREICASTHFRLTE
jgi:hypothetical protein